MTENDITFRPQFSSNPQRDNNLNLASIPVVDDQSDADVKIKICGLQSVEVLKSMIPLPVDYIGFVFARSKRQIDRERAAQLIDVLKQWPQGQIPKSVGVFVDPTLEELVHITDIAPLDVIQLHGKETPEFCRQVRETLHKPVIKVISVQAASTKPANEVQEAPNSQKPTDVHTKIADPQPDADLTNHTDPFHHTGGNIKVENQSDSAAVHQQCSPYEGVVDAFLLDTHDPLYGGGSGKTFAWEEIEAYHRWTSARGIPLLIAGGLNPDNVDTLVHGYPLEGIDVSSGVESDGVKDIDKIKQFVERARS
ncbi:phosphoribosylanthranilate isomerase [Paenibacillus kandeliae]|uniref:phosphoribosylanthranilate isomerase n=1 Tax=Paenibacillus kandeliae TaxID=3231269 RepID=UPI0034590C38